MCNHTFVCVKSIPVTPALIPVLTMHSQAVLAHHQCPLQGLGLVYCVLISNAGPVPAFISLESLDRQSSASRELSKGKAHQRPAGEQQLERGRIPRRKRRMSSDSDPGGAQLILPAGVMEPGRVFQGHQELSCDGHLRWKPQP